MIKVCHLGMPKTASSSIQKNLTLNRENVYYIGKSPYIDEDMSEMVRFEMLEADGLVYQRERVHETFRHHQEKAQEQGKDSWIFAEEGIVSPIGHPSFPLSIEERLGRAAAACGSGTRAVLLLREQVSFLKSYYRELLKYGMAIPFDLFCRLALLRERFGYLPLLRYDRLLGAVKRHFGEVKVFLFEDFLNSETTRQAVFDSLGVPGDAGLPEVNRFSEAFSAYLYRLNRQAHYRLSAGALDGMNNEDILRLQRMRQRGRASGDTLWQPLHELGVPQSHMARALMKEAQDLADVASSDLLAGTEGFLDLAQETKDALGKIFAEANRALARDWAHLPLEEHHYLLR